MNSFIIDREPGRPEAEKRKGLCAIGEALIDFIPECRGQRLKDVAAFKRAAGGAPANVAGAVSRLGLPARLLTKTGNDAFGDYLIESFAAAGIDTSFIKRDSTKETPLAFVSLAEDGNRDFQFYRKNSADLFYSPEDVTPEVLDGCGILHFGSVDLVESPMKEAHRKLIRMAAEKGIMISFDPNLRPSLWNDDVKMKETVLEFLPQADIVKISEEELEFITGKTEIREALPKLLQGKTRCVLYTRGSDGAAAYTKEWSVSRPGLRVEARDTTGAGDSFTGAFLSRLLSYGITDITEIPAGQMEDFLDFANAYAARTTTAEGGLTAMASKQEFDEWMGRIKLSGK
ncbi:carbohydrate kinase [[Clostridium] symbiosum]|uniref:carbohydrate kinase family protein n=1 Tax=Clostridium symbiosum TaxID=1512 RepID=UPI0027E1367D|nr:carbohydrate kinase [[Clostridium] symbiosum]